MRALPSVAYRDRILILTAAAISVQMITLVSPSFAVEIKPDGCEGIYPFGYSLCSLSLIRFLPPILSLFVDSH